MTTTQTTTTPANTTRIRAAYPRKGDYILTPAGWQQITAVGAAGGQHEMIATDGRIYRSSQFHDITVRRPSN